MLLFLLCLPIINFACSGGDPFPAPLLHLIESEGRGNEVVFFINNYFNPAIPTPKYEMPYGSNEPPINLSVINGILLSRKLDSIQEVIQKNSSDFEVGSRVSNTIGSANDFVSAAHSDHAVKGDFSALVSARISLLQSVHSKQNLDSSSKIIASMQKLGMSKDLGDYPKYLLASAYFYLEEYNDARKLADSLKESRSTWIAEASHILCARAFMNESQVNWDGYSEPAEQVNQKLLEKSNDEYELYLKVFPKGKYRNSALGMHRRILFLQGNGKKLNDEIVNVFQKCELARQMGDTVNHGEFEILSEYLIRYDGSLDGPFHAPLLMFTWILKYPYKITPELLSQFESTKADYKSYPGLYDLIRMYLLLVLKKPNIILHNYADIKASSDLIQRVQAILLAEAYENTNEIKKARSLWKKLILLNPTSNRFFQSRLADNYFLGNDPASIFDSTNGIRDSSLLLEIIYKSPNDSCLNAWPKRTNQLSFTRKYLYLRLFYRYVNNLAYSKFKELFFSTPPEFRPDIKLENAIEKLILNPNDTKGLLELSRYLLKNDISDEFTHLVIWHSYDLPIYTPNRDSAQIERLCCLNGDKLKQIHAYDLLLKNSLLFSENEKSEDEAETLHFLVNWFKGSLGMSLRGVESKHPEYPPLAERKKWFLRLHKKYPNSVWSKKTNYFY